MEAPFAFRDLHTMEDVARLDLAVDKGSHSIFRFPRLALRRTAHLECAS
jgi:hypothetical protein